jgi:hypothetical protein
LVERSNRTRRPSSARSIRPPVERLR